MAVSGKLRAMPAGASCRRLPPPPAAATAAAAQGTEQRETRPTPPHNLHADGRWLTYASLSL